jgi:hypothetical protein
MDMKFVNSPSYSNKHYTEEGMQTEKRQKNEYSHTFPHKSEQYWYFYKDTMHKYSRNRLNLYASIATLSYLSPLVRTCLPISSDAIDCIRGKVCTVKTHQENRLCC